MDEGLFTAHTIWPVRKSIWNIGLQTTLINNLYIVSPLKSTIQTISFPGLAKIGLKVYFD